jgi:HEAT repeat protein
MQRMLAFRGRSVLSSLGCGLLVLMTSGGCEQFNSAMNYFRGNTPGRYARLMEDENSPDNRRLGISELAKKDFAHKPPYTTRYQQIYQSDSDPMVRAMAIRALNVSRDESASALYVRALNDIDAQVRLEGAKALGNMPNDGAIDPLLKLLNAPEENQDVRIAAADALRHYHNRAVATALVGVLDERQFGVAWQARRSLKKISGVDYAYDAPAWLEYLSNPSQPLS